MMERWGGGALLDSAGRGAADGWYGLLGNLNEADLGAPELASLVLQEERWACLLSRRWRGQGVLKSKGGQWPALVAQPPRASRK